MNFEKITLRTHITSRGGGIEISLDTLGYEGHGMTAYQNYLGGGLLGRIANDCTVQNWRDDSKLVNIATQLQKYYYDLAFGDELQDDFNTFTKVQRRPVSAY